MSEREVLLGTASVVIAYLISSVPVGYLLYRLGRGGDIRTLGSGNIGATNVFRTGGRTAGIATLLLDVAKGALSVGIARWLTGDAGWEAACAFTAVLGHCFPVYLRFKGGKGIATGCGAYGLLAPAPMGLALLAFGAGLLFTRMVSVGSICAGIALPLLIAWLTPDRALILSAAGAAVMVLARHHANIRRIAAGREHRIHGA